ncbi:hypothetical protein [Vibrio barjaei]|jgi:hypothetical protein|uniref:Secreted protein n=1 Tax=Vibrio barjaei TaxID=1676683 RepID=A0ABW7IP56_9VIBR|nr:hypothetical protein [Vibrio barjaei]MCG9789667.1 hypothetical protein [Vibrio mediterranei]MCY9873277.1 hypothetical protein [Vibrio barjaei]OIN26283.1 hypothetical protein AWH66_2024285 [Vibrio barjaei]
MNNKMAISIALSSLVSMNSALAAISESAEAPITAQPTEQHGGKCAAGKCGTEKRFEKQELDSDPQDKLVRARDGKCGLSGQGINAPADAVTSADSKVTGGVCGQ